MQEFIAKHRDEITGVLSGFDRLVFRGTLRSLSHVNGMDTYLAMNKVFRKDFGRHVQQVSERLKQASLAEAVKRGRPVQYLTSPQADKEALARKIATQEGVRQGLICVLTSVELCRSFEVYRNRETKQLDLVRRRRKMPVSLPLLDSSPLGFHARAHSNLVSLLHPGLLTMFEAKGKISDEGVCGAGVTVAKRPARHQLGLRVHCDPKPYVARRRILRLDLWRHGLFLAIAEAPKVRRVAGGGNSASERR